MALLSHDEENVKATEGKKKNRSSGQKRRNKEKGKEIEAAELDQFNINAFKSNEAVGEKKSKLLRVKKRKNAKINAIEITEVDELHNEVEDGFDEQIGANAAGEKRESKLRKKKRKNEKIKKSDTVKVKELCDEVDDGYDEQSDDRKVGAGQSEAQDWSENTEKAKEADSNSEKACKVAKGHLSSKEDEKLLDKRGETEQVEVYQISSGDEDCSRGMKKWTMEYYQSRPGLKILQQRIDDFITAHEEQEEKARKEREERAAEGGWTVVVHHKGRKKTADSESGITVGSVAPAAVLDKMAKKRTKEVGLNFYRFQKREAQRNEIMMLQSKFEQDKKRIQQLRAARKFRPY